MSILPEVSIVVPVYNVEKYLQECLDSLINQSCQNIEIILVDDGSSDSSGDICEEYKRKDHRIKVIHKKMKGNILPDYGVSRKQKRHMRCFAIVMITFIFKW